VKNFLEILWTAWCLFVAAIIVIFNFPLLVLFILIWGKKENAFIDYYLRLWSRIILIFWGIRMIYIKDKKLDFNRPYIFVSNHRSYLDVFIAILGIKHYKKFLGKAEVFEWPFIGCLADKLGHIPVKRESAEAREESFQNILNVAKSRTSLFLCPEGAIYMNDKLLNEMRNGAFRVAIESQMPIVAITMVNAGELFPPHKLRIRPGKCINYMSAPFETTALNMNDIDTLRESVKEEILGNLLKHYPEGKYPIEFEPKEYEETIYQGTHNK
jgi:1-acyl-sn-glycerol-3-phosphate acyltransferase